MTIRDYWTLPAENLEERIYAILQAETAESGYLTSYNIAQSLKMDRSPEVCAAIRNLIDQGRVTEIPKGSERFRVKRDKPRHKPSSFTVIYHCDVCGMETYRREHIKMRTEKVKQSVKQQAAWSFMKHLRKVKHTGGKNQEWWVNERWGDPGWNIPGEEPCPENLRASTFAKDFGIVPEPWH